MNLGGTIRVLEAMRRHGVPRIVYASSAAVYGPTERRSHAETDAPNPTSPDGIDKLAGEHYLRTFARDASIDARSLRFFNVFGPRQDPTSPYSGVISIFAQRHVRGEPLTVFGDGTQTRDFIFAADVADVVTHHVEDTRATAPSPMNVCHGSDVSLHTLIRALEDATHTSAAVEYTPPRAGDLHHSQGDPATLDAWYPDRRRTPFTEGIADTLAWIDGPDT